MLDMQSVQDQLPALVHHGRFDHFVIADADVWLRDRSKRKLSSDQGSQYTSLAVGHRCQEAEMVPSMGNR
jgi:transposase InsO family protein